MQRIRVRRTTTPGEVPGGIGVVYEPGELALNLADGVLYFGSAAGVPTQLTLQDIAPAAPTALIGLATIPGVAETYMRSDAAPALNQTIVPSWTGLHSFTASARVVGTTASWRLSATGAAADAGNWLLRSTNSGVFTLSTATDVAPANSVYDAITVNRTGAVIDQTKLFGAAITLDGTLTLKTGVWHKSDDNAPRFYFVPNGTTHFKSPLSSSGTAYSFRNASDTDIVSIAAANGTLTTIGNLSAQSGTLLLRNRTAVYDANDGYLRLQDGSYANGVYTPGRFRTDSWLQTQIGVGNAALNYYFAWNDGTFTYGSGYLAGSVGGYTGLVLHDGGMRCTLMSNGAAGGVYNQGDSKWLLYRASLTSAISSYTIDAPSFNVNSARALKHVTGQLSDVRSVLARLRPILYRLIDGDTREQAGFIAEEVHAVCPFLSDGKTVSYDRLAVLLLAQWQAEHGIVTDG